MVILESKGGVCQKWKGDGKESWKNGHYSECGREKGRLHHHGKETDAEDYGKKDDYAEKRKKSKNKSQSASGREDDLEKQQSKGCHSYIKGRCKGQKRRKEQNYRKLQWRAEKSVD